MARLGVYVCTFGPCSDIFTRRPVDAARSKYPVCSRRCWGGLASSWATQVRLVCAGCGQPFVRLQGEVARGRTRFCSRRCTLAHTDFRAMGRLSAAAPRRLPSAEARLRRSSSGGQARAARLSKERLREIAMLGVAARLARPDAVRAAAKRASATRSSQRSRFPALFGQAPSITRLRGKARTVTLAGFNKRG